MSMKTNLSKCELCKKEFPENQLFCFFSDVTQAYMNEKFYCAKCYKKKYPSWSSTDIQNPQPYKDFLKENLDYFFPNWKNKT